MLGEFGGKYANYALFCYSQYRTVSDAMDKTLAKWNTLFITLS